LKMFLAGCSMVIALAAIGLGTVAAAGFQADFLAQYRGTPYHDSRYQGGAQGVPGKVMCAYYDLAAEWPITIPTRRIMGAGR
jgi:hypothetical protein